MYELNQRYGWSKFIIVVPSVAIREGIYKSFQMTEEHFAEDYGKKIRYFITYNKLDASYDTGVFTEPTMKGQLGVNAMEAGKHLYDYILYDSGNEREFAQRVDASSEVAVYVKLPGGFYINTPVGKYNPDWAIAFHEDKVKHIYFVAETKGSLICPCFSSRTSRPTS